MALTEQKYIDQITVGEDDVVFVRTVTVIERDGAEISREYHRTSMQPGTDLEGEQDHPALRMVYQDPKVRAVCAAAWAARVGH